MLTYIVCSKYLNAEVRSNSSSTAASSQIANFRFPQVVGLDLVNIQPEKYATHSSTN
jgi:hypothetical protein